MSKRPLLGFGGLMIPIPRSLWERQVAARARAAGERLGFMSEDHHRVRDFVVREIPRIGEPLVPGLIAGELDIPVERVQVILDELEQRLTFLFRNDAGAVVWAYPVTADPTPHAALFSTGERVHAA